MELTYCAALAAAAMAFAPDVVELKDGSRHVGEIKSRRASADGTEGVLTLLTPLGLERHESTTLARVETRAQLTPRFEGERELAGDQPHALASLVSWCLDHGLYPEAFDCADKALALAPEDPIAKGALDAATVASILDGGIRAEWPDADKRKRLLARIGGRSTSRVAFARAVLLQGPKDELVTWLLDSLKNPGNGVRTGACDLLGEVNSDRALAKLIRLSLVDEHVNVRERALASALKSNHPDLAAPYLKALATGDSRMRARAYPALDELADPRIVPALIQMLEPRSAQGGGGASPARGHVFVGEQRAFVQDFDVEIAQGAVIAKPVIGVLQSGVTLDAAVLGVVVIGEAERGTIVASLRKHTGKNFGSDAAAWVRWWKEQPAPAAGQVAAPTPAPSTTE